MSNTLKFFSIYINCEVFGSYSESDPTKKECADGCKRCPHRLNDIFTYEVKTKQPNRHIEPVKYFTALNYNPI
jgi:hypothetical protein